MNFFSFLLFLAFFFFLFLFRSTLNEDLLLFGASVIFFSFFFFKARSFLNDFFYSRIEEIYVGFSEALTLKLLRLNSLLNFAKKLLGFNLFLSTRFLDFIFFTLFVPLSAIDGVILTLGSENFLFFNNLLLKIFLKNFFLSLVSSVDNVETFLYNDIGDEFYKAFYKVVADDVVFRTKIEQLT
jgi:hypothetical protein